MAVINQKEYLKKYLSGGGKDGKKKKLKKKTQICDGVHIIDDDIDITNITSAEDANELFNTNEDAPQIVGVIDDRPMHLRIDDYRKSDLWKPLSTPNNFENDSSASKRKLQITASFKLTSEGSKSDISSKYGDKIQSQRHNRVENDKVKKGLIDHESQNSKSEEKRKHRKETVESSPSRKDCNKNKSNDQIQKCKQNSYPNLLERTSTRNHDKSSHDSDDGNDNSPPRKTKIYLDSNPPKLRLGKDCDSSPPRRNKSPSRQSDIKSNSHLFQRSRNNSDSSPKQRNRRDDDNSPPRKNRRNSDCSPLKQTNRRYSDNSPPRRTNTHKTEKEPVNNRNRVGDVLVAASSVSENVRRKLLPGDKKGKYLIPAKRSDSNVTRMAKTLDGKTAGLQSIQQLIKENEEFQKNEEDLFRNIPADVSGADAAVIIRDRKTGKIRDLKKETEERIEKEKKDEESKEKYTRWGRGLKQVDDYEEKLAQDLHEMNKPLARYADDEDLERYLKEQEREGDPMLDYIRKKKKKNAVESGKPVKQQYEGAFTPNRFGITPGHRWDGVDRSNGYEKKWFEVQNSKLAQQEEIYKWSTEDM